MTSWCTDSPGGCTLSGSAAFGRRRGGGVRDLGLHHPPEQIHRRVDGRSITSDQEVEQQTAGGSQPEAGVHRRLLRIDPLAEAQRRQRIDPHVHQTVEQPGGVRPALQRLPGQLEEQRTEGARGVHDVVPEESGLLLGIERVVVQKEVKGAALLVLDDPDDLGDESVLGAEVVDQMRWLVPSSAAS